jgi:anti-sigma factor RsiW
VDDLAKYVDDAFSPVERTAFEERLAESLPLREELAALAAVHSALRAQQPDVPSRNFTQRVMANLDHYSPPTFAMSIRNGVFLLIGVLLAGALASYMVAGGVFDGPVTIASPVDLPLSEKLLRRSLPAVSFDGKILVNAIVLLNLGLAWIVLDRTILRPWFERRNAGSY